MSATAAAFSAVSANSGLTACARSTNSCTAADRARALQARWPGALRRRRVSTSYTCSPRMRSTIRLVTRKRRERRDRVQPHEHGRGIHDLLEVVEHDQHASALEGARDALLEPGFAVVADAEEVGDRGQQQPRLEHALQQHEVRAVGEEVLGGVRHLDREPALADPAGPDQRHDAVSPVSQQLPHLGEVPLAADGRRVGGRHAGDEGCRALAVLAAEPRAGLVEALGQQRREVAGHALGELVGVREGQVGGGVVGADACDELVEPLVAVLALLDVDELRHGPGCEVVLVFEPGDLLLGCDPAVAVGVDPDEDVALREVGAVQLAGRMRARAELEHHRRQLHPLDGIADGAPFVGELAQRRAHEDPEPLVGRADRGLTAPSHEHIMARMRPYAPEAMFSGASLRGQAHRGAGEGVVGRLAERHRATARAPGLEERGGIGAQDGFDEGLPGDERRLLAHPGQLANGFGGAGQHAGALGVAVERRRSR